jgi:hypothetical protein
MYVTRKPARLKDVTATALCELWFTLFNRVELQFQENVACPKLGEIQEKQNNAHNQVSNAFIHVLFLKPVPEM